MYEVTLEKGKTYDVGGTVFKKGVPKVVDTKLGNYLKDNPVFQVVEKSMESADSVSPSKPYTQSGLKKLTVAEHEEIIEVLGGDPESVKNADQRIDLILKLQEEQAGE